VDSKVKTEKKLSQAHYSTATSWQCTKTNIYKQMSCKILQNYSVKYTVQLEIKPYFLKEGISYSRTQTPDLEKKLEDGPTISCTIVR